MKAKEHFFIAIKDLWRRKGRTFLTSLGITIGTLLIVTMVGLGTGLKDFMKSSVNDQDNSKAVNIVPYKYMSDDKKEDIDLSKFEEEYFKKLDRDLIDKLKNTGYVQALQAYISGNVNEMKFNNKNYEGQIEYIGYSDDSLIYSDYNIESVRKDNDNENLNPIIVGNYIKKESGETLVGEGLLEQIGIKPEDALNKEIELIINTANGMKIEAATKRLTIVGVIDKHFSNGGKIVLSDKDAGEIKGFQMLKKDYLENKGYDSIAIKANEISDVEPLTNEIKNIGYSYSASIDMAKDIENGLNSINLAFAVLGVIVLIVAAIGIVNTMTMAVMERTKSIGIMEAVGATKKDIKIMFLVQSSLIGFIGGGIGVLLGLGINSIAQAIINYNIIGENMKMSMNVGLEGWWVLIILVFAIVIALISGIAPANKASKLDPIEALRK